MKKQVKEFFKFLEKKEGLKVPLKTKLLNPDLFPFSKAELDYRGDLDLSHTSISSLPVGLSVTGNLDLSGSSISSLPVGLSVTGNLYLDGSSISSLPDGLNVTGDLSLSYTAMRRLPKGLKIVGNLYLGGTPLAKTYGSSYIRAIIDAGGGYVMSDIIVM